MNGKKKIEERLRALERKLTTMSLETARRIMRLTLLIRPESDASKATIREADQVTHAHFDWDWYFFRGRVLSVADHTGKQVPLDPDERFDWVLQNNLITIRASALEKAPWVFRFSNRVIENYPPQSRRLLRMLCHSYLFPDIYCWAVVTFDPDAVRLALLLFERAEKHFEGRTAEIGEVRVFMRRMKELIIGWAYDEREFPSLEEMPLDLADEEPEPVPAVDEEDYDIMDCEHPTMYIPLQRDGGLPYFVETPKESAASSRAQVDSSGAK